ncbi:hypothetical protein [Nocardioides sp.]|nr:hypothetical protein [Nocardioides sp.]HSX67132.1 hypothetical protein [Nocardioides sp.]
MKTRITRIIAAGLAVVALAVGGATAASAAADTDDASRSVLLRDTSWG